MGNPKGGEEGEFLDGGGRRKGVDKDLNLVTSASESFLDFWIFGGGKWQKEGTRSGVGNE
jgi:hypothetical protein